MPQNQNFAQILHLPPPRLILRDMITPVKIGEEQKLWTFSICSILRPIISTLWSLNILLKTAFSTPTVCVLLNLRESTLIFKVKWTINYKFTWETKFCSVLTVSVADGERKCPWQQEILEFRLPLMFSWMQLWFVNGISRFLKSTTFFKDFSFSLATRYSRSFICSQNSLPRF